MLHFRSALAKLATTGDSLQKDGRGRSIHCFLNRAVAINSIVRVICEYFELTFFVCLMP